MKCEDIQLLMADALGGELSNDDRILHESHLAECERCRRDFETAGGAIEAMRSLPPPGPVRLPSQGWGDSPRTQGYRMMGARITVLRYAAGLLIAFTAGFGLHAGLSARNKPGERESLGDGGRNLVQVTQAKEGAFGQAVVLAHARNPRRSDLAKCMMAMFPTTR